MIDKDKKIIVLGQSSSSAAIRLVAQKVAREMTEKGFEVCDSPEEPKPIELKCFDLEEVTEVQKRPPNKGPRDRWNKLKS